MSRQIVSKVKSNKTDKDGGRAEASTMTEGFPAPFSPRPTEKVTVEICVSSSLSSRTSAMVQSTLDTPIPSSASRPQTLGVVPVYPPLEYPPLDPLTPTVSPPSQEPMMPPPECEMMWPPMAPPPSPDQLTMRLTAAVARWAREVLAWQARKPDGASENDEVPAQHVDDKGCLDVMDRVCGSPMGGTRLTKLFGSDML